MRRRAIVASITIALVLAPHGIDAQEQVRRVGLLANAPRTPVTDSFWDAFVTRLREHGWVEPRNIVIDRRDVALRREAASTAAVELVRAGAEVIVVGSTLTAFAAKEVTATVPIVMTVPSDPVTVGLVESLARPGRNVTGLSFLGTELAGKQVELLKEVVGQLSSIAVLSNPTNASHAPRTKEIVGAARALRMDVQVVEATSHAALSEAFRVIMKRRVSAVVVLADPFFVREADSIIRLAAEHRLPAMYGLREAVFSGGLMSYGPNFIELFRRAAGYVDKILRGASPANLPIEQASKFELVINLKTAKALGLTIPSSLLLRADQVIE